MVGNGKVISHQNIDGADEVDFDLNLIKGEGGVLLREKIVAAASTEFIVVVDESKLVKRLGKFPLPIEIVEFGYEKALKKLHRLGSEPRLRNLRIGWYCRVSCAVLLE